MRAQKRVWTVAIGLAVCFLLIVGFFILKNPTVAVDHAPSSYLPHSDARLFHAALVEADAANGTIPDLDTKSPQYTSRISQLRDLNDSLRRALADLPARKWRIYTDPSVVGLHLSKLDQDRRIAIISGDPSGRLHGIRVSGGSL